MILSAQRRMRHWDDTIGRFEPSDATMLVLRLLALVPVGFFVLFSAVTYLNGLAIIGIGESESGCVGGWMMRGRGFRGRTDRLTHCLTDSHGLNTTRVHTLDPHQPTAPSTRVWSVQVHVTYPAALLVLNFFFAVKVCTTVFVPRLGGWLLRV